MIAGMKVNPTANPPQSCNQPPEPVLLRPDHTTDQRDQTPIQNTMCIHGEKTVVFDPVGSDPEAASDGSPPHQEPVCSQQIDGGESVSLGPSSPPQPWRQKALPSIPVSERKVQGTLPPEYIPVSQPASLNEPENADGNMSIQQFKTVKSQHASRSRSRSENEIMGAQSINISGPQNTRPIRSESTSKHGVPLPTGVVFVGNPGVGKSALLNALGGSFRSGISVLSGLTDMISKVDIGIEDRGLFQLIDTPGIYDTSSGAVEKLRFHLDYLNKALSDTRRKHIVFFVVALRSGRMDNGDRSLIRAVLSAMIKGPKVGFIFTQVASHQARLVQDADALYTIMKRIGWADSPFVELKKHLVLPHHHSNVGFNKEEIAQIQDYVFSFLPRKIQVSNIVNALLRDYFSGSSQ